MIQSTQHTPTKEELQQYWRRNLLFHIEQARSALAQGDRGLYSSHEIQIAHSQKVLSDLGTN